MNETHAMMLAFTPTEPNGGAIMPLLTGREQIIFPRASALTKATGSRTLAAGAPRQRPRLHKKSEQNPIRFCSLLVETSGLEPLTPCL